MSSSEELTDKTVSLCVSEQDKDSDAWRIDLILPRRKKEFPWLHLFATVFFGIGTILLATAVALTITSVPRPSTVGFSDHAHAFYKTRFGECIAHIIRMSHKSHNRTMFTLSSSIQPYVQPPDWRHVFYFHIEMYYVLTSSKEIDQDQAIVFDVKQSAPMAVIIQQNNSSLDDFIEGIYREFGKTTAIHIFDGSQFDNFVLLLSFHYEKFNKFWTSTFRFSAGADTIVNQFNSIVEKTSILGVLQRHTVRRRIELRVTWINLRVLSKYSWDECSVIFENKPGPSQLPLKQSYA